MNRTPLIRMLFLSALVTAGMAALAWYVVLPALMNAPVLSTPSFGRG